MDRNNQKSVPKNNTQKHLGSKNASTGNEKPLNLEKNVFPSHQCCQKIALRKQIKLVLGEEHQEGRNFHY